ncbi:NACHT, LRR and PYD domains-containing protein 3-like isoform X2 [Puntigrus tetrazona]|uniref:NACHT, LRR and PYD domains-containing protein 3-like isoform X2 n=1 Tax=Puntigrus tetrazona TaxID=1606681 RepID=UPI001C892F61|nr:NACHT, LRR and PYD domains-containing protein 3-like isoform X2 [Puntigrus tetrazona]
MSHVQQCKDGDFSPGCCSDEQERSDSPEPSFVSMKSDWSIDPPPEMKGGDMQSVSSDQQKSSDSPEPSCVSMKSDWSIDPPPEMKDGDRSSDQQQSSDSPEPSCVSMRSDWSIDPPPEMKDRDGSQSVHNRLGRFPRPRPVVTEPVCKKMKYKSMDELQDLDESINPGFRSKLKKKFECLYEGTAMDRNPTLLNEIYITESESGEISNEHELRQIETQSRRTATEDTPIKCSEIFRSLPGQDKAIRTVLTKGVAGIGKTVSVQKFILDWAEGKENQDVQLIFPLPFRELNLMKDKTLSLSDLLYVFFPETKEMDIFSDEYKVLFIFDGLDECRLSLDFQRDVKMYDVSESASVDVLLMNLIVGNLLPSALIWITSRPAAADLIPCECVHRVTEVRGFNDLQKEEYFRKRIIDQSLANRIISHLKSSRSLFIMCHIPVFCWISAAVLEKMLSQAESGEIPKTLTQMYTHFLILQTNIKHEKDYEQKVKDEEIILKLGKLSFQQLVKGNVIFYEEDLRECDIDVTEASVYSGLCTQIFREEFGWYQGKVFCFVHLSIQEHLAALYVHLSCINSNRNAFGEIIKKRNLLNVLDCLHTNPPEHVSLFELHQRAVDEALQSKNGHLDLFLRFLLGLSVQTNQNLLQGLMQLTIRSCDSKKETIKWIKRKIKTTRSSNKSINLFHCLNELGDHSLVEEIQQYLRSGTLAEAKLSCSQWLAVVFVLLTSEQVMDVFELNKFIGNKNTSDKVLHKLLPVIKESISAHLDDCNITAEGCASLASILKLNKSHLRELDLSENKLKNLGIKHLSDGLKESHCELQKLNLYHCGITEEGCAALASALRSNPSHLRELNFTENMIGDLGLKLLSDVLKEPLCKLENLSLCQCGISPEGCAALASALRSNPERLRELDLSQNEIGDSGVTALSAELENPNCKLEKLGLRFCGITNEGCAALASALRSNPEHLRELDLSLNELDQGVRVCTLQRILERLNKLLTLSI